ncbi:MAG: lysylphosphatidylglycerol synthase transmembrane domain-containing protein [Ardenticatenaceae bacterium]
MITIGLLVFVLSRVELGKVIDDMQQANLLYVLLAVLFFVAAILTNAFKWGVLLRAQQVEVPWSALIGYTFVGTFFSSFLPAAIGGDVMRGYGLARYTNRNADAAVSVIVDRLIGTIMLAGMAVIAVLYAQVEQVAGSANLTATFWGALGVTVAFLGAFFVMVSRRLREGGGQVLAGLAERLPFLRPFVPIYENLSKAIGAYRHQPKAILLALAIGAFTWIFSNLVNYLLSLSLPPAPDGLSPISLLDIFIFNPIVGLTQALPISIGGLGANQTFYEVFYHHWSGYNKEHVTATSLLMQFVVYICSLPGGVIWWFDRGQPTQEEEQQPEEPEEPATQNAMHL